MRLVVTCNYVFFPLTLLLFNDLLVTSRQSRKNRPWETSALLPKDVVPLHYDIYLNPDLELSTFVGRVNITIHVMSRKDHVILHAKRINVTSSQLCTDGRVHTCIPVRNSFEYSPNDFWIIKLTKAIRAGQYILKLEFKGSLVRNGLVGLYESWYKKKDGTKRPLASTQLANTWARLAFPCFDEPAFKATFTTTLVRPAAEGYIALSNMNEISEERDIPAKGKVMVHFAETPRMSTYLACFIVCDFPHLPTVTVESSGTQLRVYARDDQLENAKHSQKIALRVLYYFNDYFGTKYPLPKLDLIALPELMAGAMENWGLVTFRETRLLTSPDAAVSTLSSIAMAVAHELSHMWFGNLVTMGWWQDLWLNEGFATFMACAVQSKIMPDFPVQDEFVVNKGGLHYVLAEDMAVLSHPIIRPVLTSDQISQATNPITYQKAASVLQMVERFDPEGFRKAILRYLDVHRYSSANTSDLWAQLSIAYTKSSNVTRMLDTWTKQAGYPLVQVERKGNKIELRQIRCLININVDDDPASSKFGYKWDIPIQYTTSVNKTHPLSVMMKMEDNVVSANLPEGTKWFKINHDQYGFYRVKYTEQEWENIKNVLMENPNVMSSIDRANLIDDSFALAKAGYINYKVPLNLISYLEKGSDKSFAPWRTALRYFRQLKSLLYGSEDTFGNLKKYFSNLVIPNINDRLWTIKNTDPPKERYFKAVLVKLCCELEVEVCIKQANRLFKEFIEKGSQPPIDLKEDVFKHGIKGSELKNNWNKLSQMYVTETDPQQKAVIQNALTSVTDRQLIHKLLESAKNTSFARKQDYWLILLSLYGYPENAAIMWDWTKDNFDYLFNHSRLNSFGVLPKLAKNFYTERTLKELEDLMAKYPEQSARSTGRRRAIAINKANIIQHQEYQPTIKDILEKLVQARASPSIDPWMSPDPGLLISILVNRN